AVEVIVLPAPLAFTVPPPVALKPVALVVSMPRPPLEKSIVAPVLLLSATAVLAPVFSVLVPPLKAMVRPVLFATLMPLWLLHVPAHRLPLSVTPPAVLLATDTRLPLVVLSIVPAYVTLPVPALTRNAAFAAALPLIEPPLAVNVPLTVSKFIPV